MFSQVVFSLNNAKIDSLEALLQSKVVDTNKVTILKELCWLNARDSPDRALEYGNRGLQLAQNINFKKGVADCLNNIGIVYQKLGNYEESRRRYLEALDIREELNDQNGMASCIGNIGITFSSLGNYDKALEYHFDALKIKESIEANLDGIARTLGHIGFVYTHKGDYEKAIEYLLKALKMRQDLDNRRSEIACLHNLGILYERLGNYEDALECYDKALELSVSLDYQRDIAISLVNIGHVYNDQRKLQKSLGFYLESLKIFKKINDKNGTAICLNNIGEIYNLQLNYQEAIHYYQKSILIFKELGSKENVGIVLYNIGEIYYNRGFYEKAIEQSNESLIIAEEIGAKESIKNALSLLAMAYVKLNQFEKAYQYQLGYAEIKDSLINEDKNRQIAEMQTKYDTEKKEKENESLLKTTKIQELQLTRRNYIIYGLAAVAALLLVIGFLVLNQNKLRAKQRAAELEQNAMKLEQQLLRSQMNPHFIFNSLNAIQSFLYDHNPEEAGNYLSKFAILVRLILENSRREFIPLEKEIKFLEHYLELQQLRFEDAFDFEIITSSDIDIKATAIPPMLAQPFIENAVEHGFQRLKDKGQITVNFELKEKELLFTITDNGIGRTAAAKLYGTQNGNHASLATQITEERLTILNKRHDQSINMRIVDLNSSNNGNSGTKVTFQIPFTYVGFDKPEAALGK